MHNPQLPEDLAGLINDILGRMGRVEGAQCEADTLARLGDWVIHVASEAHEGTSQPEVAPHVGGAVDSSDPLQQCSELLMHCPKLDIHQECCRPLTTWQLDLVVQFFVEFDEVWVARC